MDINITLTTTDIVAWWGAIIASTVLVWDVYKWKTSGAKIRFLVTPNMLMFDGHSQNDNTYITFRVTNIGDRPTTISTIGGKHYKNLWSKLTNKVNKAFVIPNPVHCNQQLPYVLDVGQEWMGAAEQTEEIEQMAKDGYLIMEVTAVPLRNKKEAWITYSCYNGSANKHYKTRKSKPCPIVIRSLHKY